jgi:CHAD domain-containing protein
VQPGVVARPLAEARLQATYLDTPDLRLIRWGITLRHRVESVAGSEQVSQWTVKLPGSAGGVALVRQELSWPGAYGPVPPAVASVVRAAARSQPLEPVARLTTRRRRVELAGQDGTKLAEIDDDLVDVADGVRFREVEVELAPAGTPKLLRAAVRRLAEAGAQPGDNKAKVVRALGPRAEQGTDVVIPKLGSAATVAEVVSASIGSGLTRMIRHDPGVRLGDDPEHVHQARVGTRRLRSDLRTFSPLLDSSRLDRIRNELKWFGTALGEVRDADVLAEQLRADMANLPSDDSRAAAAILRRLATERDGARNRLLEDMDSDRYTALLEELARAAADPPVLDDATGARRAADELPPLVRKRWKKLKGAVDGLDPDPPDPALHQVRIRAKRLRYASEAAIDVIGDPARKLAKAVSRVQTVLGDHQDAVVAEAWLRKFGSYNSAGQALVAGELVAVQRARQQETREQWTKPWKAAARTKLRAWLS